MRASLIFFVGCIFLFISILSVVRNRKDHSRRQMIDRAVVMFGLPMAAVFVVSCGWFFLFVAPEAPMYGALFAALPFMCALGISSGLIFQRIWDKLT